METVDPGSYRISGRFGEGWVLRPSLPPLKVMEATAIEFTAEIAQEDVPLPGNETGTKDGAESKSGTMTLQQIDALFENMAYQWFGQNLDARRRARDLGQRIPRTFTMQVWQDDPEALGALGWQLEAVRLSRLQGGYNYGDTITNREHPFRFGRFRPIRAFERIANKVDEVTGLPAIRYTVGQPT